MTLLLQRLGLALPLVQAPMAGVSTPALAAAVTNAGALGSVAIGALDATGADVMLRALRAATSGPFNVNVFCHDPPRPDPDRERAWLEALAPVFRQFDTPAPAAIGEIYRSFKTDAGMLELLLEVRPAVVSFHFGLPAQSAIDRLKGANICLFATVTNLDEALEAERARVDALVAQGYEAGGHRGMFDANANDAKLGTLALTRMLVGRVKLPIIAAGAIMDGAGIAAALALGAQGAQLGTAFIACPESSADPDYRRALFSPAAMRTEMTSVVSGRAARSLPNAFTALSQSALKGKVPPDYPLAYDAGKALAAAARSNAVAGFGAQWAGQGAPLARALPAGELVSTLGRELRSARSIPS